MSKQRYRNDQLLSIVSPNINLWYHPDYLQAEVQQDVLTYLESFPYCHVAYPKYGKIRKTPRLTYCYGQWNNEPTATYRKQTFQTEPIPEWLMQLKTPAEKYFGISFNAVIMNKYVDGQQYINWHQDDEKFLASNTIASVSLGAERDFQFRADPKAPIHEIALKAGSLTLFSDGLLHSLPKRAKSIGTRYNITFRSVGSSEGIGNYYYYNRGVPL